MRQIEFLHNSSSTLKTDKSKLHPAKQIVINLDRNEDGKINSLSVTNSFYCDMSEFPKAISFLLELHKHFELTPMGYVKQNTFSNALIEMENARNKIEGRPFVPQP